MAFDNITFDLLPQDSPVRQYIDNLGKKSAFPLGNYNTWVLPPNPSSSNTLSDIATSGISTVPLATSNNQKATYYQPNPNALPDDDPRVRALKKRQKTWQRQIEDKDPTLQTIRPSNFEDPRLEDPRITQAIANAEERTYNSYYKKLNNDKNFDPNWRDNSDWEFYSLPPTSHKKGGTLQQDYRGWEKEMYDSYKCGGKTKKKSCGGEMAKKKACGGMKVKK